MILNYKDIEYEHIKFAYNTETTSAILTYPVPNKSKRVYGCYFQGDKVTLGAQCSLSSDQTAVYIDLVIQPESSFLDCLQRFDALAVSEASEHSEYWFGHDTVSITQIESELVPSVSPSTVYQNQMSMRLKCQINSVEFYDQDGIEVPLKLLCRGYSCIPLLSAKSIIYDGFLRVKWELKQLRVTIPQPVLKGCQIIDDSDSDGELGESQ
jgi:hypothetical protein